jgi:hypothetical protein
MVAVMVVGFTTTTLVKVTPLGPLSVAPDANPEPVRVTGVVDFTVTVDGLMLLSVGGAITLRQVVQVAELWSGLVIFTV